MSENTPLIKKARDEEEEYYEEYDEFELSPRVKYSLFTFGVLGSLAILYFFTVFLPGYFIPASTDLTEFIKVGEIDIQLVPIQPASKKTSHLHGKDNDDYDNEVDNFDGLEHVEDFSYGYDENNYNGTIHKKKVERLVLIGDIHGHYVHFRNLLREIKYDPKKDHIVVLGDFITKGPDSLKVLDFLMKNKIDCIMGNHEYYVLQNYATFHGKTFPETNAHFDITGFNDDPEYLLAKRLEIDHVKYINNCPIIKKLGDVPLYNKKHSDKILDGGISTKTSRHGVAVHAGLRWDLSLADQEILSSLEMRSLIGPYFNQSTEDPHEINAVSWSKIWNQHQKSLPNDERMIVYYGHDARRGLNLRNYARGLDTGCDRGDKLLAMVIWNELQDGNIIHKEKAVQVHC